MTSLLSGNVTAMATGGTRSPNSMTSFPRDAGAMMTSTSPIVRGQDYSSSSEEGEDDRLMGDEFSGSGCEDCSRRQNSSEPRHRRQRGDRKSGE